MFFLLCGATMEAAAGMLIYSAEAYILIWPSVHPHCVWCGLTEIAGLDIDGQDVDVEVIRAQAYASMPASIIY